MKKNIFIIIGAALMFFASCDNMNYHEYNVYDKDYITKNFANVGGFMTDIYNTVEYDFGNYSGGAMQASASDESMYSIMGNGIEDFYNGGWSPTNAKGGSWNAMYEGIATCNTVLTEMQGLNFEELILNSDYPQQMHRYQNYKYEARYMRAYFYFTLVRQYGGVPIVEPEMTLEEINTIKRSSADEVFKYIIDECAAIQGSIIEDYSNLGDYALGVTETGRADKLAVLALKAKAALYWASPLFNESGDKSRWETAASYYEELIAACEKRGKGLTKKYEDLWSTSNYLTPEINKEIIYGRRYYSSANGDNLVESNNYPVGIEGGAGGNCPTQNLVDAYVMTNGKPIGAADSGYDPANPYKDRDPRLALTVAVNGDKWPTSYGVTLETFQGGVNAEPLAGATPTGYYLKKLCHGELSLAANGRVKTNFHTYVIFRMGGIYLDYAEALFRATGGADVKGSYKMTAREAASKTRERVGIPAFETGMSNEAFWEAYKNERMVELAFEGHRFWDVRRWKEADKYFTSVKLAKITKNADGTFAYNYQTVSRQWNDKMYLFPIPQSEIMKNKNLTQNPGW